MSTKEQATVEFGRRVRALRRAMGLSEADLGARVGLTDWKIQRVGHGKRAVQLWKILRLADALGVSPGQQLDPKTPGPSGDDASPRRAVVARKTLLLSLLLAMGVALAACELGRSEGPQNLAGRLFVSSSITDDGDPVELAPGTRLILRFGDQEDSLQATAGCNEMSGQINALDHGRLELRSVSTTTAECRPELSEQQTWFVRLLDREPSVELEGQRLALSSGDNRVEFTEQLTETRSLAGMAWTVEAVVSDGVARPIAGPLEVSFEEDGSFVHGDGRCVAGSGFARYERGSIRVEGWQEGDCVTPGTALPLETGRFVVKLDGARAELRAADGRGIDLRLQTAAPSP